MNTRVRTIALASVVALLARATLAADGAETPDALMEKLRQAADQQDTTGVVSAILPEERPFLAFMIGMFGAELTGAMITGMASMPANEAPPDAAEKLEEFNRGYAAILAKHKVERIDPEADVDMRDPQKLAKLAQDRLGHVDYAAFIDDVTAFLATLGDPASATNPMSRFNANVESIRTDGDRAFVTVEDVDQPIMLERREGRWYLRLVPDLPPAPPSVN